MVNSRSWALAKLPAQKGASAWSRTTAMTSDMGAAKMGCCQPEAFFSKIRYGAAIGRKVRLVADMPIVAAGEACAHSEGTSIVCLLPSDAHWIHRT